MLAELSEMQSQDRLTSEAKAIGFVDCCGYSAYTDANGDPAGVSVHLRMRCVVERESALAGVTVVKWMGDGAMLAADDLHAILRCVHQTMVDLREAGSLPLRAGVTVGQVTRIPCRELDYLGQSVNLAARLCARATPWQARVSLGDGHKAVYFTLRPTSAEHAARRA